MATRVEISKRLLLVNSASTVVRRLLSIGVLFWMHQHLIRNIPVSEYALLPVVMGLVAFTPVLTTVISGGLGRFLTEAYARGDERRVTEITSTMTPALVGMAGALLGAGGLFAWKIGAIIDVQPEHVPMAQRMLVVLIFAASLRVAFAPYVLGFYIRQRFVHRDLIGFSAELLRIGLLLYLLTQHETRVEWVALSTFIAGLYELGVVLVLSRRLVPALRFRWSAMRRDVVRPILSFGSWTVAGQTTMFIREMADPLILNQLGTPADVATFHLGSQPDRTLRRTLFSATAIAQPAATAMVATGQDERLRRTWFRLSRYGLWVMLGIAVPLVVFRDEFFRLYLGDKFEVGRDASLVLALLLARLVVVFPNSGTGLVTVARAQVKPVALRTLGLEVVNIALTLVLVGAFRMGSVGAALATFVVAMVGHPLLLWTIGLRLTGSRLSDWFASAIVPGLIPTFAGLPVWIALHGLVGPTTWLGLAACGVAGLVAYLAALALCLRPEDRDDAGALLRRTGVGRLIPFPAARRRPAA